jgi:ribosomal protein L11 methyltransferase
VGKPALRRIVSQDWNTEWRAYFKPVQVTPRIVVKPPWETWRARGDEVVVDIMPRMAFGTGTHETTRLCLELLEWVLLPGDVVLDIGTGSGILGIAAVKLGALWVLGVDVDADALANARENAIQNGVLGRVLLACGSAEIVGSQPFRVVLANIDASTLTRLLPMLRSLGEPDGRWIFSGILASEGSLFEEALSTAGYFLIDKRSSGEWIGLAAGVRVS